MSSNTGYIMTLANSIIGVGILAMPFCFQKCGILLSIILLCFSNFITRLACYYLLKTSLKARRKNLEFLASYIFGSSGKLLVELCVIGYLMGSCITYFVVVGDLGPQIIERLFNLNHSDSLRTIVMIVVTIFCIIPLCLLRNIESLSAICISSIIFYFCLVLKIFFESENKIVSTYWYENVYWWRPSGITQCLPIFSMALSCQPQIFDIYESLPSQTIEKMTHVIKHGINICTAVYICVGFFGYVAFYDLQFSGNILLSLSSSVASDIIQMGFVLSVAVSFPLVVFPARASLYSLLYHRSHSETAHYIPEHRFKYITISMVLTALIIGILIPSIELIIGLVGSTIGVAICIMFPASCFIKINKKNSTEKLAAQFLLVFGFAIMILGTYANLGAIDEQQSGADISIDRLPDIHVAQPTERFVTTSAQLEKSDKIEPNKPVDIDYGNVGKLKGPKRKMVKVSPSMQTNDIREINLNENVKNKSIQPPKPPKIDETVQKPIERMSNELDIGIKPDAAKPKEPIVVPNQLDQPTIVKKVQPESVINNEAIKKEDHEIEIEANEQDAERTKEIVAQVKDALSKQNKEHQQIVLDKIKEISEKVKNLQKKNDDGKNVQDDTTDSTVALQKETQREKQVDKSTQMPKAQDIDPLKNVILPPVVKILANRNSSAGPSQLNLSDLTNRNAKIVDNENGAKKVESNVLKEPKIEITVPPPKPERPAEVIAGRDLLSNSNGSQASDAAYAKSSNFKTET